MSSDCLKDVSVMFQDVKRVSFRVLKSISRILHRFIKDVSVCLMEIYLMSQEFFKECAGCPQRFFKVTQLCFTVFGSCFRSGLRVFVCITGLFVTGMIRLEIRCGFYRQVIWFNHLYFYLQNVLLS